MSAQSEDAQAKSVQRKAAKRATLEMLRGKKPKRQEFTAAFGPGGSDVSFLYVAMGAQDFDELLTRHPPTTEERANGASYHADSFGPALLAQVCVEPRIDAEDWAQIWTSSSWGRGEISALFWRAMELCNEQVPVNPTVAG